MALCKMKLGRITRGWKMRSWVKKMTHKKARHHAKHQMKVMVDPVIMEHQYKYCVY